MTAPAPLLAGRAAVVTGGATGAGPAVCVLLAAHAASIAIVDDDPPALGRVVARIRGAGGRGIGIEADCLRTASIERARRGVERRLGPADLLVALATGGSAAAAPPEWDGASADIAGELVATFLAARVFLPGMIDRGRGTIATAPGLGAFARHLALGLAGSGVRVAAVLPTSAPPAAQRDAGQARAEAVPSLVLEETPRRPHLPTGLGAWSFAVPRVIQRR